MRSGWRDHRDRPVEVPPVPAADADAFYTPIGDFQGATYRRNAFAAGTAEEAAALRGLAGLEAGTQVLDVGCGDARHLRALAGHPGVRGVGVDVSPGLIAAGREAMAATRGEVDLVVGDARRLGDVLDDRLGTFDVAWSLCQGGFGTSPTTDPEVVRGLREAVRPGGLVILTAFHALFAVRHLVEGDAFDPIHLVHHHRAEVHGPDAARRHFDLWTSSYTVPGLVRLVADAGLESIDVRGVEPGGYGRRGPGAVALDDPEILIRARRPID